MPTDPEAVTRAFFALVEGLPRQSAGSDATTRALLRLAGPLPPAPRALDIGCGPGRAALLLAAEAGAHVVAVDTHQPFLDELADAAVERGLTERITPLNRSMDDLGEYADGGFDLVWAEGSAYIMGFDAALESWARLLAPGGALVLSEPEWATPDPAEAVREFWRDAYPLRTSAENVAAAQAAGYDVEARLWQPDEDWWAEYYRPLAERLGQVDRAAPGMAEAAAAFEAEIRLREQHPQDYRYTAYVLRRSTGRPRVGRLADTVLDCPDAEALAAFWCRVLGLEVTVREPGWVTTEGHGRRLSFQQVSDYRAPDWPGQDAPQQVHLDVLVPDLADATTRVLDLGATALTEVLDPGPEEWRIFTDPAGHAFCLVTSC